MKNIGLLSGAIDSYCEVYLSNDAEKKNAYKTKIKSNT